MEISKEQLKEWKALAEETMQSLGSVTPTNYLRELVGNAVPRLVAEVEEFQEKIRKKEDAEFLINKEHAVRYHQKESRIID